MKTIARNRRARGVSVRWGRLAVLPALLAAALLAGPQFSWAQNQPPVANAGPDQTINLTDPAQRKLTLHGTATDAENDPIQNWQWTIVEHPDGETAAMFVSGQFSDSPVLYVYDAGTYRFALEVSDAWGTSTPATVTVTALGAPHITSDIGWWFEYVGATVTFSITATGTEPLSYQWQFNGADLPGATSPELTLVNLQRTDTGYYSCIVANAYGSARAWGQLFVSVYPNHPPVANAGPDQTMYTHDGVILYGSASDPDADTIVGWQWAVDVAPPNAVYSLFGDVHPTPGFDANTPGTYVLSLVVSDGFGLSTPDTVTITVRENQPPVAVATADKLSGPAPLTVHFDASQSYDPEGKPLAEYFWEFGDGSIDNWSQEVSPIHTFTMAGTYNVVILTVIDERGATTPGSFDTDILIITVTTANAGPDQTMYTHDTIEVAGSADPNANPTEGWQWAVDVAPPGAQWQLDDASAPTAVFTADTPGDYVLSLVVFDGCSWSTPDTVTITVTEPADTQPPQVTIVSMPAVVQAGMPFTILAQADDTATGNSGIASADYSLDGGVNWTAMVASDGSLDAPLEQVQAALVNGLPVGVYSVLVRATDSAGNTGLSETMLLAVYDPTGGFVTGGGWINSPVGAFNPGLEEFAGVVGKANFGFVAKYQKGANVPTGNTEFQFKAGNLNFKSTAYEWLVVAGAKAQYKGWGTINGQGNYAFMLTAIDGQVNGGGGADRFRIKLWDEASGTKVYDNQHGTDDSAGLAGDGTLLQGGSIVIHKK